MAEGSVKVIDPNKRFIVQCTIDGCNTIIEVPLKITVDAGTTDENGCLRHEMKIETNMSYVWSHMYWAHQDKTYEQQRQEWIEEARGWHGV